MTDFYDCTKLVMKLGPGRPLVDSNGASVGSISDYGEIRDLLGRSTGQSVSGMSGFLPTGPTAGWVNEYGTLIGNDGLAGVSVGGLRGHLAPPLPRAPRKSYYPE